jgi:hypothetical protein
MLAGSARAATLSAGNEAELIQAIDDANANVGADTIDLTADIMLTAALPTITDALTLAGAGGQRAILRDDSGANDMIAIAVGDVTNSTVSENEANAPNTPDVGGGGGGGIMILGEGADFTLLALFNSTISGNHAPTVTSGGIRVRSDPAGSAAPIVLIESTIVAGNEGISGLDEIGVEPDTPSKIIASHSLIQGAIDIGEGTFTADTVTLALRGQDPQLEALAYNGGSTPAHALPATSPAIDQGFNTQALPFDQRGAPWARAVGVAADIGAYELDTDRIFAGGFD